MFAPPELHPGLRVLSVVAGRRSGALAGTALALFDASSASALVAAALLFLGAATFRRAHNRHRLTPETVESPLRGDAHGGSGERP